MTRELLLLGSVLLTFRQQAQITDNPPLNSIKDTYTSGSYTRCAYNVNLSETHLSSNVTYFVKAGESIRIQASSGTTPYSNAGNFSGGSFHAFIDPNYNLTGCGASGTIVWDNIYTGDGSIAREVHPLTYQLYPRNSSNKGTVVFSGTDNGANSTITFVTTKTNYSNVVSTYSLTTVSIVNKRFSYSLQINAELSEYTFSYYLNNDFSHSVTLAEHVVCGDAYIISGQSNASTNDLSSAEVINLNSTYGAGSNYGKYSRSVGGMYATNDWGVSKVGGDLAWHTGAWGLPMQYKIQETYGIPTCFINGAVGATSIEHHVPLPSFPNDFFYNPVNDPLYPNIGTNPTHPGCFARMNTRVYNGGLENSIKGIFWWQGDAGTDASYNYIDHFTPLYNLWATYYPNFSKTYMVQIPSWVENDLGARQTSEYQRQIGSVFPSTTVMSANGIGYHRDDQPENNCGRHINPVDSALIGNEIHHQSPGYINLSNRLFALLEKDVYGKTTNINDLTPPNIALATISGTRITLKFNQDLYVNSSYGDNISNILEMIKFNNEIASSYSTPVSKTNSSISGQYLSFDISSATGIAAISYAGFLPNKACVIDADFACYLRNSKNVAALSFHNFPVTAGGLPMRVASEEDEKGIAEPGDYISGIQIYPNPFSQELTITTKNKLPVQGITITDLTGRLVFKTENNLKRLTFDLSFLKAGVYFIQVENEGLIEQLKLVKIE
jgi:hypothetical protein